MLYIIDAAGIDGRNPLSDFETLVQELSSDGDGDMLNRRAIVVANKIDLVLPEEMDRILPSLYEKADQVGINLHETKAFGISAGATGEGLGTLTKAIRGTITARARAHTHIGNKLNFTLVIE